MNTLVQQDKLKFTNPILLLAINHQFIVTVSSAELNRITVKHIYDTSYTDYTTLYPDNIVSIHLSSSNHLVVVTDIHQVDVVLLSADQLIMSDTVKAFQKKGPVEIIVGENFVGMIVSSEKKMHLLVLERLECMINQKHNLEGIAVKGAYCNGHIYVLFSDNSIKKWTRAFEKFEMGNRLTTLKDPVVELKAMQNGTKTYLVCLSKQNQVSVLADDGKMIDIPYYQGEFKKIILHHQLLTIVSKVNDTTMFTLFYAQDGYRSDDVRMFFTRSEKYVRNANYKDCYFVPIPKKQWNAYNKKKGTKEMTKVKEINDEVYCLVFGYPEIDCSRLDMLKIDMMKILKKERDYYTASKFKIEENVIKPALLPYEIKQPDQKERFMKAQRLFQLDRKPLPVIKKMELTDGCLKTIEKIIEARIAPLLDKIGQLQDKINVLQAQLASFNCEQYLTKLYTASLQKQVHDLFENKIVPKMDMYFQQIFSDLSQVFNQGIEYYNQKLIFQTDLQKNTFKTLISHTLSVTKDIVEATRADMPERIRIQALLNTCVEKKDQLLKKAEQLLEKVERGPFSYKPVHEKEIRKEEKREQKREEEKEEKRKEKESREQRQKEQFNSLKTDQKKKKTFIKSNIE